MYMYIYIHIHAYQVQKGGWLYKFGDHGGIIVMVLDKRPTRKVIYSLDEGKSWRTIPVKPISASGILTTQADTTVRFIIVGRVGKGVEGATVAIDLSTLKLRRCGGEKEAGSPESDYEQWNPRAPPHLQGSAHTLGSMHGKEGCLLGRRIFYVRRKQLRECLNGHEHERSSSQEACECTDDDFECDFSFELEKENSFKCVWAPTKSVSKEDEARVKDMIKLHENPALSHEFCNRYGTEGSRHEIAAVTGYRRIPGDFCRDGVNKAGKTYECAAPLLQAKHGLALLTMCLACACGVAAVLCAMHLCANTRQRERGYGYRRAVNSRDYDPFENVGLFSGEFTEAY